ncbi:MAG TPA: NADH-quinone oxidoreductase subunit M, partial [Buchnera sp. (in: enterobacteria)]|nr:NADH-quinone oxidoreductase subunit M [Buchnera sp. (in: enterobacteria)]
MFLILLIIIPCCGAVLCWFSEIFNKKYPRWIALITSIMILILTLKIWYQYFYKVFRHSCILGNWASEFSVSWIPKFGINFHLGVDELSVFMIILSSFLGFLAVLCSWNCVKSKTGLFYLNLILLLGSAIGVFLALDLFLFFVFWEMTLIPMYFLIVLWGYKSTVSTNCIKAANKFFIYTQASGMLMIMSIIGLVISHYYTTGILTFNYNALLKTSMNLSLEYLLMLGFLLPFLVKIPVVPFHGWLADIHQYSPIDGSVDLLGILLKTGIYGLLRFIIPMFPHTIQYVSPIAMWLGIFSIFYGAWVAVTQNNIKRLLSYSSISHMGFILTAIYANIQMTLQGIIVQIFAYGVSSSALFILVGQLYERTGTRNMKKMSGLWLNIKWIPAFSLFFTIANLGMPGTGNFVSEFIILMGIFNYHPIMSAVMTLILIFSALYLLGMIQKIYFGSVLNKTDMITKDIT